MIAAVKKDTVALVSGAAGGIGRAVVEQLVASGARVGCIDIDAEGLNACVQAVGTDAAIALPGDVSKRSDVERATQELMDWAGRIDVLVHAAGILRTVRLLKMSEGDWDEVFATNVTGRFMLSQTVARRMIEAGRGGVIIDVGSLTTERVTVGRLPYCAGNEVSEVLHKAMAVDLGKYGIRVVTLSTGPIRTAMLGGRADEPERLARFLEHIPLRRLGEPSDVAAAVCFLVGDDATYITGSTFHLDGGWLAG
jgi:NAD(P)-dependent dehydrogenase (short-subunit alcohol dehydrogenase family)